MRFTEEALKKIDEIKFERLRAACRHGIGVTVEDGAVESCISHNGWEVCKISELSEMITDLQNIKEAIKEATGVIV